MWFDLIFIVSYSWKNPITLLLMFVAEKVPLLLVISLTGHGTNSTTFLVVFVAPNCARTVPRERSRCGHDTHAKGKINGLQACLLFCLREDVSAWKRCRGNGHFLQGFPFPYYWPFVRRIQRSLDRRITNPRCLFICMIIVFAYISQYTYNSTLFFVCLIFTS